MLDEVVGFYLRNVSLFVLPFLTGYFVWKRGLHAGRVCASTSLLLSAAILKRISEVSGGQLEWTDGMLYPLLHRLDRLGYVNARWRSSETGRRRKYYRITKQGREALATQRRHWEMVDDALRTIWHEMSLATSPRTKPLPHGG